MARGSFSLRPSQQALPKAINAAPATRPTANPVGVSNEVAKRSETTQDGASKSSKPVASSTKAITEYKILIAVTLVFGPRDITGPGHIGQTGHTNRETVLCLFVLCVLLSVLNPTCALLVNQMIVRFFDWFLGLIFDILG